MKFQSGMHYKQLQDTNNLHNTCMWGNKVIFQSVFNMTSQKKPLLNEILHYKSIAAIIFKRGTQNNEQTANNQEIT